ncbi:hypothetical protein CWS01_16345 [Niallia nealsonii]|uniref:Uncharacterized protein n=1 Tax=Niallia nealsonii TaxID=115979 RepID=A0A2N0YZL1_9BACI|nr:hypothetical protein CWS01_16345 [Niallia nealsonii]
MHLSWIKKIYIQIMHKIRYIKCFSSNTTSYLTRSTDTSNLIRIIHHTPPNKDSNYTFKFPFDSYISLIPGASPLAQQEKGVATAIPFST